jgi:hypothetical protein
MGEIMKHCIITYIDAFYKVKTTGYIKAVSPEEAVANFGIVKSIIDVKELI